MKRQTTDHNDYKWTFNDHWPWDFTRIITEIDNNGTISLTTMTSMENKEINDPNDPGECKIK